MKNCVLYDRKCNGCGECDICDLNPNKKCDNCGECIKTDQNYKVIKISKIIEDK